MSKITEKVNCDKNQNMKTEEQVGEWGCITECNCTVYVYHRVRRTLPAEFYKLVMTISSCKSFSLYSKVKRFP
jgi:hypothetical protein